MSQKERHAETVSDGVHSTWRRRCEPAWREVAYGDEEARS